MVLLQGPIGGAASGVTGKVELVGGNGVITIIVPAKAVADKAMAELVALMPAGLQGIAGMIEVEADAALSAT